MLTFLNAAGLRLAKEMIFTAQPLDADRAERLGLINQVVPAAELKTVTLGLAQQIAANAPLSVAVMKEQLRILAGAHPMIPQGLRYEATADGDFLVSGNVDCDLDADFAFTLRTDLAGLKAGDFLL